MTTETFETIFHSGSSGCVRTCPCGTTYFDSDDTTIDWEEGELEDLCKKAKKYPGMFIEKDFSIQTFTVFGKEYVCGCLCGLADRYEDFINQHGRQIAEYLNKKAESLKNEAREIEIK